MACSNRVSGTALTKLETPMFDSLKNSGRRVMDPLGKLCFAGQDAANYLFQVPDDASQWDKIEKIIDAIIVEAAKTKRRELPSIAEEMKQALQQPHSAVLAEQLLDGFDRMTRLWKSAKSGLMNAEDLRNLGE
jgi:hypothetical protein